MPSGDDPTGVQRFSLATNAERVCAEIMLNQKPGARWRFNLISSRSRSCGTTLRDPRGRKIILLGRVPFAGR